MTQTVTLKRGIVTGIVAVTIQCPDPDCGGYCENESGSTMIEEGDEIVTCVSCHTDYIVPATAFKLRNSTRRSKLMQKEINGSN